MADHEALKDGPRPGVPPRVPRWVKVTGLVVAVLVALALLVQLTGAAGDHGPGRHLSVGPGPAGPTGAVVRLGGPGW